MSIAEVAGRVAELQTLLAQASGRLPLTDRTAGTTPAGATTFEGSSTSVPTSFASTLGLVQAGAAGAVSSEALRVTTARTAPSSSTSSPRASEACRSHSCRVGRRLPVGWKTVPTGRPLTAPATCAAEVRTVGIPADVAILAASTLVIMPPRPSPEDRARPRGTPSRSAGVRTARTICDAGLVGLPS